MVIHWQIEEMEKKMLVAEALEFGPEEVTLMGQNASSRSRKGQSARKIQVGFWTHP